MARRGWLPFLLLITITAFPAFADTCTVVNGYTSGGAVSGCYSIITNNNEVVIELQNLTPPISNVGQTLTDFEFNLTRGFSIDGSSLSVVVGGFLYCNGTTCSTLPSGVTGSNPYGWQFNSPSGTFYDLNMLSGQAGGWDCSGLGGGACNLAGAIVNDSATGTSGGLFTATHNPYLTGPVYFTFDVTSDNGSTVGVGDFTNVELTWGTNGEVASPVPEPASLALFGSGLIGIAGMLRRRWRSK